MRQIMAAHTTIEARSTEAGPSSANQSENWFVVHWRSVILGLGGLAAGATAMAALMGGPSEVSTGITSHLPPCSKKSPEVKHRSYEQPGAVVDVKIGDSNDKKITVSVIKGSDVTMKPSEGMLDLANHPVALPELPAEHTIRSYQAGDEVRTIIAMAAPNNETALITIKPC